LKKERERKLDMDRMREEEEKEEQRIQTMNNKKNTELARLVHDAHQPRRTNTRENKSDRARGQEKLRSAKSLHDEKSNSLKRIERPYEVVEVSLTDIMHF
jgi:membrane-bound lytic murein transglycosylase B